MRRATLLGTGSHHPAKLVPNRVFDEQFGPGVDDWLVDNLTIRQRYWVEDDEATSDLCVVAAEQALAAAGVGPEQLDLIVLATDTPDYLSPSTASIVQHRLGAARAGTFDVNAACSGFVIGVDTASKFIAADPRYQHVLVLGGYAMSRHLDHNDKKTVTLFADGAGAAVLGVAADDRRGVLGARMHTEGQYHDWMGIYAGGTRRPVDEAALAEGAHKLRFVRKFPKEVNPLTWVRMVRELCGDLQITPGDVDHYVFTQLNINSIHESLDGLEVPRERGHTVMHKFGYTGSACIPMALHDLYAEGRVQPGEIIMLVASGGGLSFAALAFRA